MTENEIPALTVEEFDDVEAHGLREVAAAAGIGAAVLGGGGAALAATNAAPVAHPVGPAITRSVSPGELSKAEVTRAVTVAEARGMTQTKIVITDVQHLKTQSASSAEHDANNLRRTADNMVTLHLQVPPDSGPMPDGTISVKTPSGVTVATAKVVNGHAQVHIDPTKAATIHFHPSTAKLSRAVLNWSPAI